jgi:hypothetical protein
MKKKTDDFPGSQNTTTIIRWTGSQAEAATLRKEARQTTGYVPNSIQTEIIDVPTKKQELIKFLNKKIVT